jgi:hypothetical protein
VRQVCSQVSSGQRRRSPPCRIRRPEIKITEGIKAVINDPGVVATAEKVLKAAFGDKFRPEPPVTPSEDCSEFINAGVPSMFFRIGVYEPERVAARATARNCRATTRPCSRQCRSRPLKPVLRP